MIHLHFRVARYSTVHAPNVPRHGRIDYDLDHLDPNLPLRDIVQDPYNTDTVQIQLRKHVLDHADYTAPVQQHELDHTDQESIRREISRSCSGNILDYVSDVCLYDLQYTLSREYHSARVATSPLRVC